MIDKLELRIEQKNPIAGPPFTEEFGRFFADLRNDSKNNPFRENRYYLAAGSLVAFGYDVRLHLWSKPGKHSTHKLEFLGTGDRPISAIIAEGNRIFNFDLNSCEIARVDLAVDIPLIPARWFLQNCAIRWKQFASVMAGAEQELCRMGKGKIETMYFGKRPNIIRIYDKKAEMMVRYRRAIRRSSKDQDIPTVEDILGVPLPDDDLTRIERQISGDRLPENLSTLGLFRENAIRYDPFEAITFLSDEYLRELSELKGILYFAVAELRNRVRLDGVHNAKKAVYQKSNGQGARTWKRLVPYLVISESDCIPVTRENILDHYYKSLNRQLSI